jgi:hypothetical protein
VDERTATAKLKAVPVAFVKVASDFDAMVEVTDKDGVVHYPQAEREAWGRIKDGHPVDLLMYDVGEGETWVFEAESLSRQAKPWDQENAMDATVNAFVEADRTVNPSTFNGQCTVCCGPLGDPPSTVPVFGGGQLCDTCAKG